MRIEYDIIWKEAVTRLFPRFLQLLFPQIWSDIDWKRPIEFLEKELRVVMRAASRGGRQRPRRRVVDLLVRVWLLNGEQRTLLIHVEVQTTPDPLIGPRVVLYHCLLRSTYLENVATLLVYADPKADWRPSEFGEAFPGGRLVLELPTVKLLDWEGRWSELELSDNPFALFVMAHLRSLSTRRRMRSRLEWKVELAKLLMGKPLPDDEKLLLIPFLDGIMAMPDELEHEFEFRIVELEETNAMPYVSPLERRAHRRGREEGREEGRTDSARAMLRRLLHNRLGPVPAATDKWLNLSSASECEAAVDMALRTESHEEFIAAVSQPNGADSCG